jgi:hypothetical protein
MERECPQILGFPVSPCFTRVLSLKLQRLISSSYAGKLQRIERQIHHYGSALNGQVLLEAFRDDPTDSYLLRVGYGGVSGPLSSISQAGHPACAFHSFPDTLKWDGYSGDYGPGFLGMALNSGTYVAQDQDLGLVAYGGVLQAPKSGGVVTVQPRDPVKKKVFIGPLSLLVEIDAGAIESFSYSLNSKTVSVSLLQSAGAGAPVAKSAVMWLESTSSLSWQVTSKNTVMERQGWKIPLPSRGTVTVNLGVM